MFELCILFSLVAVAAGVVATVNSHIPALGKVVVIAILVLLLVGIAESSDESSARLCAFFGVIIAMIAAIAHWKDGAKPFVIAAFGILLAWFLIHDLHLRDFYTPHTPRPISHAPVNPQPDPQVGPNMDSAPEPVYRPGSRHRAPSKAYCDGIYGISYKRAANCPLD